jgi:hypothetical protein
MSSIPSIVVVEAVVAAEIRLKNLKKKQVK